MPQYGFFETGIRRYPNKHGKKDPEVRTDKKQLLNPQIPGVEGSQNTIRPGSITKPVHVEVEGQVLMIDCIPGLQDSL